MKKQLLLLCIASVTITTLLPLEPKCLTKPLKKTLDEKYETGLYQLQTHLEKANLTPLDRNNLVNKLIGYFSPPAKNSVLLKNKQAQLIYTTVIKTYHELLTTQNNPLGINSSKAKQFAEHALGKILLCKIPQQQKIMKRSLK